MWRRRFRPRESSPTLPPTSTRPSIICSRSASARSCPPSRPKTPGASPVRRLGQARAIRSDTRGDIQTIDGEGLLAAAEQWQAVLRLESRPGSFVRTGALLMTVHAGRDPENQDDAELRRLVMIGTERTGTQDLRFFLDQLVELAVLALSLGINALRPHAVVSIGSSTPSVRWRDADSRPGSIRRRRRSSRHRAADELRGSAQSDVRRTRALRAVERLGHPSLDRGAARNCGMCPAGARSDRSAAAGEHHRGKKPPHASRRRRSRGDRHKLHSVGDRAGHQPSSGVPSVRSLRGTEATGDRNLQH